MNSIGFFFGAGAEIGYGLPSGAKFALELFKAKGKKSLKNDFKEKINLIPENSFYAVNWFPNKFKNKNVCFFTKKDYSHLIESSLEFNRKKAILFFDELDTKFIDLMSDLPFEIDASKLKMMFDEKYSEKLGFKYKTKSRINKILCENDDGGILGSIYYSALLTVIKESEKIDTSIHAKYAVALMQIFIGAHGKNLIESLNEEMFLGEEIPISDSLGGLFKLQFSDVGEQAFDLLLCENVDEKNISSPDDVEGIFTWMFHRILQSLVSEFLNYQGLIDGYYKYLFSPKSSWTKFTKIVLFLMAAKEYIKEQCPPIDEVASKDGYYHDLKNIDEGISISVIGTSNYTEILSSLMTKFGIKNDIFYLNGCINDFYNPYKNTVYTSDVEAKKDEIEGQVIVPFMFTQSGVKPLTSIKMSKRYVDYFNQLKKSSCIVCVGFGFNQDDGHINGMFRELLERGVKVFVVDIYCGRSEEDAVEDKIKSLRASHDNEKNLDVVFVDRNRNHFESGRNWLEEIQARMNIQP